MILKDKKIVIMGIRNKWSIAWGAAQSAHEQGAQVIFTCGSKDKINKIKMVFKGYKDYKKGIRGKLK